MKIGIISGSINCLPLLQFLRSNSIDVFLFPEVMEQTKGDFEMITHFCKNANIIIEESRTLYQWLSSTEADLVFVLGFPHWIDPAKIPSTTLSKIFNIHFGALPDFRGPNPVFWQLKNGVENVCMCIHRINDKFDDGPVVWLKQIPNEAHFTFGFLEIVFSQATVEGVSFIINQCLQGKVLPELSKDNSLSMYYKRPQLKDVMISWTKDTSINILHLINACNPWNKGAVTLYKGNEVKIIDAEILSEKMMDETVLPGTIIRHHKCLHIACVDKNILSINMLNINGTFLPDRYADKLGFTSGGIFITL